ncbi:MAG: sialate O-acetylesterase [Bacteroidota bacterium]|nr:sialate O-acetylesterase [Bacteroidota bacterium]
MNHKSLISFLLFFFCLGNFSVQSEIKLPCFINNGMVLQRDLEVPVWGWASAGEKVQLEFKGKTYNTVTSKDGKWNLKLKPSKAGGPYQMIIKGSNSITIMDILIGDVWLCSGQSNMSFDMGTVADKYAKEIVSSENSQIRQFIVKRKYGFNATPDVETDLGWQSVNPKTITNFTAVGYFFAKEIYETYKVPIGLINCSYPGSPAQAWINESALKQFPAYYAKAIEYKDTAIVNKICKNNKRITDKWYNEVQQNDKGLQERWVSNSSDNYNDWGSLSMPDFWQGAGLKNITAGIVWLKKDIDLPTSLAGKNATLYLGNIVMSDSTYINGHKIGFVSNRYNSRKYLVDGQFLKKGKNTIMIRILSENAEGGFIKDKPYKLDIDGTSIDLSGNWQYKIGITSKPLQRGDITNFSYQPTSMYYGMLSPLIGYGIKGVIWYQGEGNCGNPKEYQSLFPVLINSWRNEWEQGDYPFLYVQLANFNPAVNEPGESNLAALQESQSMALSLPHTGMAVINDLGEWNDVHPSNKYDVGKRLALAAQKVAYHDKKIVSLGPTFLKMKIEGNKIIIAFSNIGSGLIVKGGKELKQFAIAGADKKFVWAKAKIIGNKVIVWSDKINLPVAVRYAWADNPQGSNLYNREGLPASCFRTDK